MDKTAYEIGVGAALEEAGLTKEAVLPAVGLAAGVIGRGIAAMAPRAALWGRNLMGGGGVARGALGHMAKGFGEAATTVGNAFSQKGVLSGMNALRKTSLGSGVISNSVLGGGIGAYTAPEGQKMQGAASGAGWGAVGGVAFGGVSSALKGYRAAAPFMRQTGASAWFKKKLTNPTFGAMAATMALPTGMAHGGGGAAQAAGPGVAMSNLATNVQ